MLGQRSAVTHVNDRFSCVVLAQSLILEFSFQRFSKLETSRIFDAMMLIESLVAFRIFFKFIQKKCWFWAPYRCRRKPIVEHKIASRVMAAARTLRTTSGSIPQEMPTAGRNNPKAILAGNAGKSR